MPVEKENGKTRDTAEVTPINDGLSLLERGGGLKFGTDALLLAGFLPGKLGNAAEFGCGSGGISLLAAYRGKAEHIDALELNPVEAEIARENVCLNHLEEKITVICSDLREFASESRRKGCYDTIFSNPPYMKPGHGFASSDPGRDDARRENNGDIFDFAAAAAALLRTGGCFYTVYLPSRIADLMTALRASGLEPKKIVSVCGDPEHKPSLILTAAKKGASPSVDVFENFFIRRSDGTPGQRYASMLESGFIG